MSYTSKIPKYIEAMERANKVALTKGALTVHKKAVENATPSVDTGRLRASLTYSVDKGNPIGFKSVEGTENDDHDIKSESMSAIVGTNVVYARAIEFGHSKKTPNGYLRMAFDSSKETIKKFFKDEFGKVKL